jgi:GLPGLI family protein
MRKIILMITMVVLSLSQLSAQIKEGKLIFERKINMHRMITDPEMRRNIPEFRSEKFELIFNEQATMFKTLPNEDAPDPFANSGGGGGTRGMNFMFRMPETNTYTDIASQMQYEARSIFENDYLIIDTLKPNSWKLSDETKTIANYVCKKATTSVAPMAFTMRFGGGGGGGDRRGGGGGRNADDTTKQADRKPKEIQLVVWYTEAIPLSIGPDTYSGLPGAILEVDSDNGSNVISAINYIPKFSAKELKQPTKGKKLNRAQFQTEMQTIMKDMQRGGGFGGIRIRADN